MRVKPSTAWSLSLALSGGLWVALPGSRFWLSLLLLAHLPVLVWGIVDVRSQFFGRVHCSNRTRTDALALTFDDGPDPELTPDILALLAEYGATATFFVVAERARRYPQIVRSAVAAGHEIGCHDLTHAWNANFRRSGRMLAQMREAQAVIAGITGAAPRLYRPPNGIINPHVHPALDKLGMVCVGWSRRPGDAGNMRPGKIRNLSRLAGPGEVIVLHDVLLGKKRPEVRRERGPDSDTRPRPSSSFSSSHSPDPQVKDLFLRELRGLLEAMKSRNLSSETVSGLLGLDVSA